MRGFLITIYEPSEVNSRNHRPSDWGIEWGDGGTAGSRATADEDEGGNQRPST